MSIVLHIIPLQIKVHNFPRHISRCVYYITGALVNQIRIKTINISAENLMEFVHELCRQSSYTIAVKQTVLTATISPQSVK
jgi:hypothetical protein